MSRGVKGAVGNPVRKWYDAHWRDHQQDFLRRSNPNHMTAKNPAEIYVGDAVKFF